MMFLKENIEILKAGVLMDSGFFVFKNSFKTSKNCHSERQRRIYGWGGIDANV